MKVFFTIASLMCTVVAAYGASQNQIRPAVLDIPKNSILVVLEKINFSQGSFYLQNGQVIDSYTLVKGDQPYCWFDLENSGRGSLNSASVIQIKKLTVPTFDFRDSVDTTLNVDDEAVRNVVCRRPSEWGSAVSKGELDHIFGAKMLLVSPEEKSD